MSNLFTNLQIRPDDFSPLMAVAPAEKDAVRVSISPPRDANGKKASARLNIAITDGIYRKLVTSAGDRAAVFMGTAEKRQLLLCSQKVAEAAFPNVKAPLYTLHAGSGVTGSKAARRLACQTPWWCASLGHDVVDAASFAITDQALLIELPASFLRPDVDQPVSNTETVSKPITELGPALAPLISVEAQVVEVQANQDAVVASAGTERIEALPEAVTTEAAIPSVAAPVADKPATAEQSADEQFRQDCDSLYGALLGMARTGVECPANGFFGKNLIEGEALFPNYVTALFGGLLETKRVSWCYVDKRGNVHSTRGTGRVRVVTFLTGAEQGLTTANPFAPAAAPTAAAQTPQGQETVPVSIEPVPPVVAPEPPPAAQQPMKAPRPVEQIKAVKRGHGLSDAERELQDALVASKPQNTLEADFAFLVSKGVKAARNPLNTNMPFIINGTPVTESDLTKRAATMRALSRGVR